tara:strand:- start:899 stop:1183 length:285 start_codon:yes stop_codon:yes gene_type:complete
MNGKKAKRIRKQASIIIVDWLQSLLSDEEGQKINTKNYINFMPKQTHFMAQRTMHLNAYHPKWIGNKINQLLAIFPDRSVEEITLEDIQWKISR